ncbi:MAG: hypothetical protein DRP08_06030, partial [Candidatus Aenigmatarchaeota archaeon]
MDKSNISGGSIGLESQDSEPVLLNSTLDNDMDVKVGRGASASLVNCTLDQANVTVEPSGHIDLGGWIHIDVVNQTYDPVPLINISVLDSSGVVAGSGQADEFGHMDNVPFRQARIFWNRTETHSTHDLLAFGSGLQGMNTTALVPGQTYEIRVISGSMGWMEWTSYRTITVCELYFNKTIIAHDSAVVDLDGCLRLHDSQLWMYGHNKINLQLDIKWGTFEMLSSVLKPIAVSAPLQPFRFWLTFRSASDGFVIDSEIHNIHQVTAYSSQLQFMDSKFSGFSGPGLDIEKVSPEIQGMIFERCSDGIWIDTGYSTISDSEFRECAEYGLYAQGGGPSVNSSYSTLNRYGFAAALGYEGAMSQNLAQDNEYGFHVKGSSALIDNCTATGSTNTGFYFSDTYSVIRDSQSMLNEKGLYCTNAWPDIINTTIEDNNYGIYLHQSGPFLDDCSLEGNDIGYYDIGGGSEFDTDVFSSGLEEEQGIFVSGGIDQHVSLKLPARAQIKAANISVTGQEIGNDALFTDSKYQVAPAIYGDWVVWQDNKLGNWDIFAYNLSVDTDMDGIANYLEYPELENDPAIVQITTNTEMQGEPDIHGDVIVYSDLQNGNYDIYAHNMTNGTTWPVCTNIRIQRKPAVFGDHIVWEDDRNGNYDIFMYNISKGEISQLSTSTWHDMGARIHENIVVWYAYTGSPGSSEFGDIWMFDIEAWRLNRITDDDPLQYSPDIWGDTIVWHDQRNGNWEIYAYDIPTYTEERLTFEVEQSFCPRIYQNNVTYYYHDRIEDFWSVRIYDLNRSNQTILE